MKRFVLPGLSLSYAPSRSSTLSRERFTWLAALALFCCSALLCAATPDRIVAHADFAPRQPLPNHHPLWANNANSIGAVPADTPVNQLTLVLARSPEQQAAFEQFLADQQNPASPNYHHWLTPSEVGQRFGISDEDIAAITGWLQSQGLTVNWIAPSKFFIGFGGSAASVGHAFQTELRTYRVNGVERMSVASDPQIPQSLAPFIKSIRGLYTIDEKPYHLATVQTAAPDIASTSGAHYIGPSDFSYIYDDQANALGNGINIGIVGESRTNPADFLNFRDKTGYSSFPALTEIIPTAFGGIDPGPAYTAPPSGNVSVALQSEATLDVTRAGSIALGANLLLVVSTPAGGGIASAAQYLVQTNPVPAQVISISFGACESEAGSTGVAFWDSLFQQAAAEGISVFVASGDSGASGCDGAFTAPPAAPAANSPNYICSSSYATCVGGTEFNDSANPSAYWNNYGNATQYIPEGGWNEPQSSSGTLVAASGGGVSAYIATPSWQTGLGVPSARSGRYTPDVSLSASCHDAYFACFAAGGGSCVDDASGSYHFAAFCGTSASAPSMAGIAALLDDYIGAPQGNINSEIYQQAAAGANAFHDATPTSSGVASCDINTPSMCNNSAPGPSGLSAGQPGYPLTDGYDEVTGLGSPDILWFVDNFQAAPTIKIDSGQSALDFGTRIVGVTSASSQIEIRNSGASLTAPPMHPVTVTIDGPNASDFAQTNNCQIQFPVNVSCTVQVTFTPSAAGTRTAALTLVSDNAVNSPKQVPLSGIGTTTRLDPVMALVANGGITTADPEPVSVYVGSVPGYPVPTGTVALTGSGGVNFPATNLVNGAANFNIAPGVLPLGFDSVTSAYTPDAASSSIYNPSSASTAITVTPYKPTPIVTVTPSSPSVTTYQAFSVLVHANSSNGLAAPAGTFQMSIGPYLTGGQLSNGSATINIPPGVIGQAGTANILVNLNGDDNYTYATGQAQFTVTDPVGSFIFAAPSLSVAAGATTGNTTTLTVTPTAGFTGSVDLHAAITSSPDNAQHPPVFSFGTTPTITFTNSDPITVTFYAFTTAPTNATITLPTRPPSHWYAASGAAFACILFLWIPCRHRKLRDTLGAVALLIALTTGLLACGGGGGSNSTASGSTSSGGTTPGHYVITITGTSGAITATGTVNLTVQ